jgi:hypothetical protein
MLLAGDHSLGATDHPTKPVAYFETSPVKPDSTLTVTFDAGFSRDADGGTGGLSYFWDFGDGTHAVGERVTHTFSGPTFADVKLAVRKGSEWGTYRQAVAVGSPTGAPPATNACGTLTPGESAGLISAAERAAG